MPTPPTISGVAIPIGAAVVLREILTTAGIGHCSVTSVARTPLKQASIMYQNCVDHGVDKQLALYAAAGDQVIRVFEANRRKPKYEVVGLMEQKIIELAAEGKRVSRHIEYPGDDFWVFDVAPSSIDPHQHQAFEQTARKHPRVLKVLGPQQSDPAFHLEVSKAS